MACLIGGDLGEQIRRGRVVVGAGLLGETRVHGIDLVGLAADRVAQVRRDVTAQADQVGFSRKMIRQLGLGGAGEVLGRLDPPGLLRLGGIRQILRVRQGLTVHRRQPLARVESASRESAGAEWLDTPIDAGDAAAHTAADNGFAHRMTIPPESS